MKSLTGLLIATLLRVATLVVGVAGVAGAFDGGDDDKKWVLSSERAGDVTPKRPGNIIDEAPF